MRRSMLFWILALAWLVLVPAAYAGVAQSAFNPWTTSAAVVIALVPSILMLLKKVIPPAAYAVLPILNPVLGIIVDQALSWLTGESADPTHGAMYGALGLVLRETVDQVRKADWSPQAWTPPPGAAKVAALALVGLLALSACASSTVGKAVQATDVQKQLVEVATVEVIKLHMKQDPVVTDAIYAQVKDAYSKWAAAEQAMANALAAWKVVASTDNEAKLTAALGQVSTLSDSLLALLGKFVNLDELRKRMKLSITPELKREIMLAGQDNAHPRPLRLMAENSSGERYCLNAPPVAAGYYTAATWVRC